MEANMSGNGTMTSITAGVSLSGLVEACTLENREMINFTARAPTSTPTKPSMSENGTMTSVRAGVSANGPTLEACTSGNGRMVKCTAGASTAIRKIPTFVTEGGRDPIRYTSEKLKP